MPDSVERISNGEEIINDVIVAFQFCFPDDLTIVRIQFGNERAARLFSVVTISAPSGVDVFIFVCCGCDLVDICNQFLPLKLTGVG